MSLFRYAIAIVLRLTLRLPLALLAGAFLGLGELCERLGMACRDGDTMLRQITELPYVGELRRAAERAEEARRTDLLRSMREDVGE